MELLTKPRVCGSLRVTLHRTSWTPGDAVAGVVHVLVDSSVSDAILLAELRGVETVEYDESDTNGDHSTRTSSRTFLKSQMVLFRGNLAAEGLDVPFAFQLPADAPHSTSLEYGWRGRGLHTSVFVGYSVVSLLYVVNSSVAHLEETASLMVTCPPVAPRVGPPVERSVRESFQYGFFKKDSWAVHAQLDADVYAMDATITAVVSLELGMPERFKWVRLSLHRLVHPHGDTREHPSSKEENDMLCLTRIDHRPYSPPTEHLLQLPISANLMAEPNALKPTAVFHHFSIAYEAVVTCKIKGCSEVRVAFPVAIMATTTHWQNALWQPNRY